MAASVVQSAGFKSILRTRRILGSAMPGGKSDRSTAGSISRLITQSRRTPPSAEQDRPMSLGENSRDFPVVRSRTSSGHALLYKLNVSAKGPL
jgi:hypothetical protein